MHMGAPMTLYINHITLDTGDNRRSPRDEVPDAVIATLKPHIDAALRGGSAPIPGSDDTLKATATGAFLVATVLIEGAAPAVTFGVAPRSRGAAKLWEMLHLGHETETEIGQPPPAPWCAVRIEDTTLASAPWLADYERCIAWTWLAMRRGSTDD